MSKLLSRFLGQEVAILVPGPKGMIVIRGTLKGEDEEFIEIEAKGGMLGGKAKTTLMAKAGIAGVRLEGKE